MGFSAGNNLTQLPAPFQKILKFCTFLSKFLNILSFFALILRIHTHALLSKIGPDHNIFGKIYLKAVRDLFFNILSAVKGGIAWGMKERGDSISCWGVTFNRTVRFLGTKFTNLEHVRLESEKRWQIIDGFQSVWDYPSILK